MGIAMVYYWNTGICMYDERVEMYVYVIYER